MRFEVMETKGQDVQDPDTGELLGSIERPKVRVEISKVQERLSIASTYTTVTVNVGGAGIGELHSLSRLFMPPTPMAASSHPISMKQARRCKRRACLLAVGLQLGEAGARSDFKVVEGASSPTSFSKLTPLSPFEPRNVPGPCPGRTVNRALACQPRDFQLASSVRLRCKEDIS